MRHCSAAVNSSTRRLSKLVAALLALTGTCGAADPPPVRVRDSEAFTIVDVAAQRLDLRESAFRFAPPAGGAASTGAYRHAAAEYGIVVAGSIERWEDGTTRDVTEGTAFASPPGTTSASRATQASVLMCASLAPHGVPDMRSVAGMPASPLVTPVFQNVFTVDDVPTTPFTLVEQLIDLAPGASTIPFAYGARAYITVANGSVALKRGAALLPYQLGKPFSFGAGETIRLTNPTSRLASVMVVLLLPETVRFTRPPSAY
jgi:hypothetical protein